MTFTVCLSRFVENSKKKWIKRKNIRVRMYMNQVYSEEGKERDGERERGDYSIEVIGIKKKER